MTQKDYIEIAAIIKGLSLTNPDAAYYAAHAFAITFERNYALFKPRLFIQACGVDGAALHTSDQAVMDKINLVIDAQIERVISSKQALVSRTHRP